MRPGTPHFVLTAEDCLSVGGHFYSTATYELTLKSVMHEFYAGNVITNTHIPTAPIYLFKTLGYYHSWMHSLVDDSWDTQFAPRFNADRLAALLVTCWYVTELPPRMPPTLQSQKSAEEKWPKSSEHKHDAWRVGALARYVFEVHEMDLKVRALCVETRFLRRAKMAREDLGKRLRLPALERIMRAFVDPRLAAVLTGNEVLPDGVEALAMASDPDDMERAVRWDNREDESDDDEDAEGTDDSDGTVADPGISQAHLSVPLPEEIDGHAPEMQDVPASDVLQPEPEEQHAAPVTHEEGAVLLDPSAPSTLTEPSGPADSQLDMRAGEHFNLRLDVCLLHFGVDDASQ